MARYSNAQAMRSLIKASLQAILKSPSAIVFTIAFPLIFILVFGFLGEGSGFSIKVAAAPGSDTTSGLYAILHQVSVLKWVNKDSAGINKMLKHGDIVATIDIRKQPTGAKPEYKILLNAASSELDKARQLDNILTSVIQSADPEIQKRQEELVSIDMHVSQVRNYKAIDFILPGQLSFSLLASGVFGTAFVFFNLRQTLVLKRFFCYPGAPWRHSHQRGYCPYVIPVDRGCYYYFIGPPGVWLYPVSRLGYFFRDAAGMLHRAAYIYGLWVYHQQRCQK